MHIAFRCFVAILAFAALSSRATTFEPLDFDQLSTRADRIFIGTVTAANASRMPRGDIVTDFVFGDVEAVKGTLPGSDTSVRMLGGVIGDESLTVPGAPTFRVGGRYLVFIEGNGRVMFPTLGGPQGIFRVVHDDAKNEAMVLDYAGNPVMALPSGSGLLARPKQAAPSTTFGPAQEAFTKDAFVAEIRKRIEAAK